MRPVVRAAFAALVVAAACSNPSTASHASPSPTSAADYGPPPPGVALVYVRDASHPSWLIGFDWSGRPRATLKLARGFDPQSSVRQAPDGSAFAYAPSGKGGFEQFLDRLGNTIPNQDPTSRYQDQMWADDSRQLCALGGGVEWDIGLRAPAMPPTSLHPVALNSTNLTSGIIAITLAACSPATDRAVLQYSYFGRPAELWVVRISDGKILEHAAYAAGQVANIVASPDASLVAVNSAASTGQVAPAAASTRILRTSDMSVVASLDPSYGVVAFNSDDSLALAYTTPWASGVATHLALVDVRSGSVAWHYAGGKELGGLFVQPGGRDFAVMLESLSDQGPGASVDLRLVHADGTSTAVPGAFVHP